MSSVSEDAITLAVIMERKRVTSKWVDHRWEAVAVAPDLQDAAAGPRRIGEDVALRWLYPGLELRLHGDEAENYLLNIGAPQPRVFVMWRLEDEMARPQMLTVSYGEAARMMDASEQVDGVPLPADLLGWVADFAWRHFRPPEHKRGRYASSRPAEE